MKKYYLLVVAITILFIVGCEDKLPTENNDIIERDYVSLNVEVEPKGIQMFDSYSTNGGIKLVWNLLRSSSNPMGSYSYDIDSVGVYISETNADEEFYQYIQAGYSESDSITVLNLETNKIYYFRIATISGADSIVGISKPIMTMLGNQPLTYFSELISLSDPPKYITNLSWNSDGDDLALIRRNSQGYSNIFLWNSTTKNSNQITNYTSNDHRIMGVSSHPDSAKISFSYTPTSTFAGLDYKIMIVYPSTSEISSVSSGNLDSSPCWFDANKILFTKGSAKPNIPELFLLDLTTNSETNLTNDQNLFKNFPDVNSTETSIVFSGRTQDRYDISSLYLTTFDSQSKEIIIENKYWDDIHPYFVDNSIVYFTSDRSGHYEIWSIDINTNQIRQETFSQERGTDHFYGRVNKDKTMMALISSTKNYEYYFKVLNL